MIAFFENAINHTTQKLGCDLTSQIVNFLGSSSRKALVGGQAGAIATITYEIQVKALFNPNAVGILKTQMRQLK